MENWRNSDGDQTGNKRRAADIEARIAPFLPQEKGFQQTVLDAMEYSVFAGGKRLRPMLMEASYQMFDGTNPAIDDFMAAIEMIHTYSLIHDDLPAMDNDEYRRGEKDNPRGIRGSNGNPCGGCPF